MGTDLRRRYFAEFTFDPESGELSRDGRLIPLEHQPSIVLSCLVLEPGALVSRRELAEALWGERTHVNYDDGLNYCLRRIRAALGDDPRTPRFIETIPRRGYRFIAAVSSDAPAPGRAHRRLFPLLAVAALVLLTIAAESQPNNHHETALSVIKTLHDLIF